MGGGEETGSGSEDTWWSKRCRKQPWKMSKKWQQYLKESSRRCRDEIEVSIVRI